jgi:hypothetical protein
MESFENHKLPVLRDRDATDPARIVRWAKEALTCGQAHPKVLEKYNLLRFCVSEEVREMWAALTEDVEGAPADDYPEDINIDSTDTEELAKKRDWHVEWLQAVISYYSTSQQDSVYDAIRQHVAWTGGKDKPTLHVIAEWALSCARAEKAVAPEAWSDADPKALFAACAKVLPEAIRTLLQQNKPEGGQHTWKTAAKFLNQRTRACEADDVFRNAVEFVGTESSRSRSFGNSNSNSNPNGRQRQQWGGRGAKGTGQRGRGRGQWRNPHATADEEKEPDAGKGKGSKKGKSGKGKGKASGKPGDKRKRDGKGDADAKPAKKKKKDDVTCFNCGETGHYRNQCKNPLRITDGSADAEE